MSGDDGQTAKWVDPSQPPDTGVATHVDIKSLEGAVPWLEGLKTYVQQHLIDDADQIIIDDSKGQLYFGRVDNAKLVWGDNRGNGFANKAISTYRDVAHALYVAAEATKSIVQNYKDVEHNNALNAAAVDKAFAANSTGGSPAASGSSGNGSTQGST